MSYKDDSASDQRSSRCLLGQRFNMERFQQKLAVQKDARFLLNLYTSGPQLCFFISYPTLLVSLLSLSLELLVLSSFTRSAEILLKIDVK